MTLLQLIKRYCDSKNLIYTAYLEGVFGGLTEENMPPEFIEKQYRYHMEWLKKSC